MKIVICGSMLHSNKMIEASNNLNKKGHETIFPHDAERYADGTLDTETRGESTENKIKNDLIRDYYNKIKDSDAILVVNFDKNDIKNYIGGNTFLEMGFAHVLDKKIYLYNNVPDMSYTDEILAMQPIVINQYLSEIK